MQVAPTMLLPTNTKKHKKKWPFLVVGLFVILAGVVVSYYLFSQTRKSEAIDKSTGQAAKLVEYNSPEGFSFSYPSGHELIESGQGIVISGESEIVMKVGTLNDLSLRDVALSSAKEPNAPDPETVTINSRTGYKVAGESGSIFYFPLVNDKFLEITARGFEGAGNDVLSSLRFTAPRASLK